MENHNKPLKRNYKDSVFTKLFSDPFNIAKAYSELHPHAEVRAEEIEQVSLSHVLTNGVSNDLSFIIRNRAVILIEAQSNWDNSIALRLLRYYASLVTQAHSEVQFRQEYLAPEFYVIYPGDGHPEPTTDIDIRFYSGIGRIHVQVPVLRSTGDNSLIDQYCRFCIIGKEERNRGGSPAETASRIVERCLIEGVLYDLFDKYRVELEGEMRECMNQEIRFNEYLWHQNLKSTKEGIAIGTANQAISQAIGCIKYLLSINFEFDEAVKASAVPSEYIPEVLTAFPEYADDYRLKHNLG